MPKQFLKVSTELLNIYVILKKHIKSQNTRTFCDITLARVYKPMIEVQMRLYKSDHVNPSSLCYFLVSILMWYILLIPWPRGIRLIYMPAPSGLQARAYISGKSVVAMV